MIRAEEMYSGDTILFICSFTHDKAKLWVTRFFLRMTTLASDTVYYPMTVKQINK